MPSSASTIVTWKNFLTTKLGIRINVKSSIDSALYGNGRTVEKSENFLQIEIGTGICNDDVTCHVSSLEDSVAHDAASNPTKS